MKKFLLALFSSLVLLTFSNVSHANLIEYNFASGTFSGTSLTATCTLANTNPCTLEGITVTTSSVGVGALNLNTAQGYGATANGGGSLDWIVGGVIERVLFAFSTQVTLDYGWFRFLTEGEAFSVSVDGGSATNFYSPSGTVSNAFTQVDLSSLSSGSNFIFTAIAPATPATETHFRISGLAINVPEPNIMMLLSLGLLVLGWSRHKKV